MQAPSPLLLRLLRSTSQLPCTSQTARIVALCSTRCLQRQSRLLTTGPSCQQPTSKASSASLSSAARSSPTTSANMLRTPSLAPRSRDRGPTSTEDTQTDFGAMNVLGNTPPPATAIDATLPDGFHLSNGVKIGGGSGCLLIGGEAFEWRPWEAASTGIGENNQGRDRMVNQKGQWEVDGGAWGLLELVWPKPELLIIGMGGAMYPLAPATRQYLNDMGIRIDILDTGNASAQFNLLATERGVGTIAAALIPTGWKV